METLNSVIGAAQLLNALRLDFKVNNDNGKLKGPKMFTTKFNDAGTVLKLTAREAELNAQDTRSANDFGTGQNVQELYLEKHPGISINLYYKP